MDAEGLEASAPFYGIAVADGLLAGQSAEGWFLCQFFKESAVGPFLVAVLAEIAGVA